MKCECLSQDAMLLIYPANKLQQIKHQNEYLQRCIDDWSIQNAIWSSCFTSVYNMNYLKAVLENRLILTVRLM